ncbi:MAG: hypothetical protein OXB95_07095, partial [Rhodobacteraceae bacterium]|nr:hypothetical protein [Paracoccaceae bacterium]
MAHTSETAFNFALAESLRNKHPLWRDSLHAEQTNVFQGHAGLRPDILFLAPGCQPLVVETEYEPANTVENDAIGRLERVPVGSNDPVEQAIAVRIPIALGKDQGNLAELIARAKFEYCVFTGSAKQHERWPSSGWLSGDIDALAQCAEHAMISQRLVKQGLDVLEDAVRSAAAAIGEAYAQGFVDIQYNLGRILCQVPGKQTNRMAATIIANALMFHSTIAGSHYIPSIWQIQNDPAQSVTRGLLDTWKRILQEINYWPIFKVASDLLAQMPAGADERVLNSLIGASEKLALKGINTRHDLTGRLFQQMIADRKFLATYYTLSTSAALLAELGIGMLDRDWSDLDSYPKLRIADLSCGTGTLLSAAYHAVLARYRHAGGDDRKIHRKMIENAMVAADIMPAATHLCAAQLSSAHPSVTYNATRVYTMPYGAAGLGEGHRGLSIGSLDLIEDETSMSLFSTGRCQAQGGGEATEVPDIRLPHGSSDLVIMTPPFTRPGSDVDTDQPIPSFAGFDTSAEEQRLMSAELSRIRRGL